jgi:hypothetical protein
LVALLLGGGYKYWIRTDRYLVSQMIDKANGVLDLGLRGGTTFAQSLVRFGYTDDGITYVRRLQKPEDEAVALADVGRALADQGKQSLAHDVIDEAVKNIPNSPENTRYDIYGACVDATKALAEKGRSDLAGTQLNELEKALPLVPGGNNRNTAEALLAEAYIAVGASEEARKLLLSAIPDDQLDGWGAIGLAKQLAALNLKDQANVYLDKSLEFTDKGDKQDKPNYLISIAAVYHDLGDESQTEHMTTEAMEAARAMIPQKTSIANTGLVFTEYFRFDIDGTNYATALTKLGHPEDAAYAARREGNPHTRIKMLASISVALKDDQKQALMYAQMADQEVSSITDRESKAEALIDLGDLWKQLSDRSRASDLFDRALAAAREIPVGYDAVNRRDNSAARASVLASLSGAYFGLGQADLSAKLAHEAQEVSTKIVGDPSYSMPPIARALARSGDKQLAVATAYRALPGEYLLDSFANIISEMARRN